jgi:hypothetical protein
MTQPFNIQSLVDDLEPVRSMNPRRSIVLPVAAMLLALAFIVALLGARADVMAGEPTSMFLLRGGMLLLLGLASAWAVVRMASPSVGRHDNGWKVALAAAALFPLAAILVAMKQDPMPALTEFHDGMECLRMSVMSGLFTAIPMVLLLRRGAPTSPGRAGWVTGVAAGGLGAFAYSLHCPSNGIIYIGFWYTIAVGICAVMGRLVVPRLIRW